MGLFGFGNKKKLDSGLSKTRTGFFGNIVNTLIGSQITDDLYDELEEQLILADCGADVSVELVESLRKEVSRRHLTTGEQALAALKELVCKEMEPEQEMELSGHPAVILVIGVNGVGKTTSIAKLAHLYKDKLGKKVLLAAGDTFRAAASEQLEVWADRAGVPILKASEGADPASVIFDAVQSAAAKNYDLVIADTAGRLHNKAGLMAELTKISRSITKAAPEASVETLLVLDAITGQNAISQAKEFIKAEAICKACGFATVADDSGLCVDALSGAPGVYSARYAGEHGNDDANNEKLLGALQGVALENRTAQFVSAVCFMLPDGRHLTCEGQCPGWVSPDYRPGDYGFGYDPIFVPDGVGMPDGTVRPNTEKRSYSQLTPDEKDAISHRGRAMKKLQMMLPLFLNG